MGPYVPTHDAQACHAQRPATQQAHICFRWRMLPSSWPHHISRSGPAATELQSGHWPDHGRRWVKSIQHLFAHPTPIFCTKNLQQDQEVRSKIQQICCWPAQRDFSSASRRDWQTSRYAGLAAQGWAPRNLSVQQMPAPNTSFD